MYPKVNSIVSLPTRNPNSKAFRYRIHPEKKTASIRYL